MLIGKCQHSSGDTKCGECWSGYPKMCQCHGLIHAQYDPDQWDGVRLILACDNCGEAYRQTDQTARKRPKASK